MKHPTNFRLNQKTLTLLEILTKELHTSKTAVVEQALQILAEQKFKAKSSKLMTFCGVLNAKEADGMLQSIYQHRVNKQDDIEL